MSELTNKTIMAMTEYCSGDLKHISRFIKVHSFAKLIGETEGLDAKTMDILELAAVLCGIGDKNSEEVPDKAALAGNILKNITDNIELKERVRFLVSHNSSFDNIDDISRRILLEADFLVKAEEEELSTEAILSAKRNIFRTACGTELLDKIYALTSIYELPISSCRSAEKFFTDRTDSCITSYIEGRIGTAFVDDLSMPAAAAVVVGGYMYIEGSAKQTQFLCDAFELARKKSLTIITLDKKIKALISEIYGDRCTKTNRYQMNTKPDISVKKLNENIAMLPREFEIIKFNEALYEQALSSEWSRSFVMNYKDYKDFAKNGRGYAVTYNGRLVCGTSSYSTCSDGYEIMIATHPAYRRKGLAVACASKFILSCFKHNKVPHWDCANEYSFALSRKLGYTLVREYTGIKLE